MYKWLLVGIFMLCISSAYAMQISEVMYDLNGSDTNREYVEIYNNDSSFVDMTGWKFFEANTNHGLTLVSGNITLDAGDYAIIALDSTTFLSDNSGFSGTLFDSSWSSLDNSGETLGIKDASLNLTDSVTYSSSTGANGNGKSLQLLTNGTWCEGTPTPGKVASCGTGSQPNNNTNNSNDTGDETNETKEFEVDLIEFPAKAAQGDNFSIMVKLKSNLPSRENVKVYSYVYKDQALATEGGWTANQKFYEIESGEEIEVELYNAVKSDAAPDFYFLRVRAAVSSKNYDTTEQIEVVENPKINAEKIGEISSFYTRVKNLGSGREIKLYANVKNLLDTEENFVLRLENQTREISLDIGESMTVNFTVILPNANSTTYLLELLQNNTVVDSKELPLEVSPGGWEEQSEDEEISEEPNANTEDRVTGGFTWNNSKPNTPLLLLAIVMVIIIIGMSLTLVNLKKRPEQIS